ncbi:MAG: MFS transporter [Alphaproteobacteria bacterium]|nr:MFS transporter [Alphaproteobacteria bacterium]
MVSDPPKATRREWIGLAVLALPCLLYSMDLTVLILAVPHLTADLVPSATQLLWIVDIYGFLLAGSLITMGTLGDRIGRRKLLLIGGAAFGVVSLLAAFSVSAEMLIAARALLGLSAATLAPSTLSLIRNMFLDARQRRLAIGVWVASFSVGGAIGPLLGGLMLEHFWWGSVFVLNAPIMLLLLAIGPILLPEFRDPHARRLDLMSTGLSLVAVLAVIYGIKRIAVFSVDLPCVFAIVGGLAVGIVFVWRQRRLAEPLIDVSLFRHAAFSGSLALNVLMTFIAFGSLFFIAQYLQLVLGMGPLEAGLWTAPSGAAFAVGSMLAPLLVRRFRRDHVIAVSFVITAAGFCLFTQIAASETFGIFMAGFLVLCVGIAPVGTLTTDLVIGSAPPERAGLASGISETRFEFGGALGIAVLGSIITAAYRTEIAGTLPGGISSNGAEIARDTLAGAVAVAQQLPEEVAGSLLEAARAAFTRSLALTAVVSAVISILAAIVSMFLFRRVAAA